MNSWSLRLAALGIALILSGARMGPAADPPAKAPAGEVIKAVASPRGWRIETAGAVYQVAVASDGVVIPVYFGPRGDPGAVYRAPVKVNPKVGSVIREVPVRGGFVEQAPAVEVVFADGVRECDLVLAGEEIAPIEGRPGLRLDLRDAAYGLEVSAYYRVIPEFDVIEKWLVLKNGGKSEVTIENGQSSSIWLPGDDYDLVQLSGRWGHEFLPHTGRLTPGTKTIQVRDFVAHNQASWFAVRPAGQTSETAGPVWFGSVAYSGNWRIDLEKKFNGPLQVLGGINFWDTQRRLKPGESFTTPKMIVGLSSEGMGGASRRLHDYVRGEVLPAGFRQKLRPVLYNSWYATTFNVNEEQQLALAKVAKEIGVELFVIDDGWFKGRVNDKAGLGDWTVDRTKFPSGLGPMIKKINDMGLEFGIWVEPEMVNPDSDLYRAHPEWALNTPNRARHESRNQLMLNLAREDVCAYLLESMTSLLKENNIKFIKWDRNRPLSETGWAEAPLAMQREVRLRYMQNLYQVIDELRRRFPEVWFESCSGGGGRADLGMLSRMDQVWTSDNTDPFDRLFIQFGYSHALPANTMVNWVTDEDWHKIQPSLKFRFHASMGGVLGVGSNITRWSEADRKLAGEMIALYKRIRPLVQQGVVHRLRGPQESERVALEYVSRDGSEAAVLLYNLREYMEGATPGARAQSAVLLRGLDPQARYVIEGDFKGTASGESLMNIGVPWFLKASGTSGVLHLKKQ